MLKDIEDIGNPNLKNKFYFNYIKKYYKLFKNLKKFILLMLFFRNNYNG